MEIDVNIRCPYCGHRILFKERGAGIKDLKARWRSSRRRVNRLLRCAPLRGIWRSRSAPNTSPAAKRAWATSSPSRGRFWSSRNPALFFWFRCMTAESRRQRSGSGRLPSRSEPVRSPADSLSRIASCMRRSRITSMSRLPGSPLRETGSSLTGRNGDATPWRWPRDAYCGLPVCDPRCPCPLPLRLPGDGRRGRPVVRPGRTRGRRSARPRCERRRYTRAQGGPEHLAAADNHSGRDAGTCRPVRMMGNPSSLNPHL